MVSRRQTDHLGNCTLHSETMTVSGTPPQTQNWSPVLSSLSQDQKLRLAATSVNTPLGACLSRKASPRRENPACMWAELLLGLRA